MSGVVCDICDPCDKIGIFEVNASINQRQRSILNRLTSFYTEDTVKEILIPMISQSSEISLRSLDWLVTNFAKKHNIVCHTKNGSIFNIYHSYKLSLTHFRRRNFDPFRRRQRINIRLSAQDYIETTVGQVNFMHWAYVNGVLEYAIANSDAIDQDMNTATSIQKLEKKRQLATGICKRRRELSKAPRSKCSVYQIDTHISFNSTSDLEK